MGGSQARRDAHGGAADRGSAEARGPIDTYKGVSVCVVLCSLWVVGGEFLPQKKRQKKRHVDKGCWLVLRASERMRVR